MMDARWSGAWTSAIAPERRNWTEIYEKKSRPRSLVFDLPKRAQFELSKIPSPKKNKFLLFCLHGRTVSQSDTSWEKYTWLQRRLQ